MTQTNNSRRQIILKELDDEWGKALKQPKNVRGQTWNQLVDRDKLREMMLLARERNEMLVEEANTVLGREQAKTMECRGGQTLLGNHYATGDRIFYGMNPGDVIGMKEEFVDKGWPTFQYGPTGWPYHNCLNPDVIKNPEKQYDGCWDDITQPLLNYKYAKRCRKFFDDSLSGGELYNWIQQKTTHTLATPWRTKDISGLQTLNQQLSNKIDQYSKELVNFIIRHHQPKLKWIIACGKQTADRVRDFSANLEWRELENNFMSANDQRSKWCSEDKMITLLQIPHFRSASNEYLDDTREWLKYQLGLTPNYSPLSFTSSSSTPETANLPIGHRDGNQILMGKCKNGEIQLWKSDKNNWGVSKAVKRGWKVILHAQKDEKYAREVFDKYCSDP